MLLYELFNQNIFLESVHDKNIFKAVFMAGSPGAGKSTIAKKLFSHTSLKVLNVDKFWELYYKKKREGNYDKYWELYQKLESNYVERRLGLLIDGSGKNPEIMQKIKSRLENLGYETAMVFINTSLENAHERVIKRAEIEGRTVDPKFVNDAWKRTQSGLGQLQNMFGQNFYIIDNDNDIPDLTYVSKSINKWLAKPPHLPAATAWINSQK